MGIVQISLLAVVGVITAIIIKNTRAEFGLLIIFVLSSILFGWVLSIFEEIKIQFEAIDSFYNGNRYFYKILFKIIGITYLCEFTSGVCKDAGYQTIANQVELIGKMIILMSGMPILLSIIEVICGYQI